MYPSPLHRYLSLSDCQRRVIPGKPGTVSLRYMHSRYYHAQRIGSYAHKTLRALCETGTGPVSNRDGVLMTFASLLRFLSERFTYRILLGVQTSSIRRGHVNMPVQITNRLVMCGGLGYVPAYSRVPI